MLLEDNRVSILFFDTETNDGPDRNRGRGPAQLRVVQLAAVLVDGEQESSFSVVVRPAGWTVTPGTEAVHGISTERAAREGIDLGEALDRFDALATQATTVVAHNLEFDQAVLMGEYGRLRRPHCFAGRRLFCTMQAATPVVKVPGRYGKGFKWPTLAEAYQFFTAQPLQNAHDALADAKACRVVYEALTRGRSPG